MPPWQRTLYLTAFAVGMINAGFSAVMPFLPLFLEELGLRSGQGLELWSGLIYSATFLAMAVMAPIWGAMADRSGPRRQMLRSGIGLTVVVAAMALVQTHLQLMFMRFLQGVAGGFGPSGNVLVASGAPRERSGYALGVMQSATAAGLVIGPLFGGVLARLFGDYRPIFLVTAAVSVVATAMVLLVPEHQPRTAQVTSGPGAGLGAILGVPAARSMLLIFALFYFSLMSLQPVIPLYLRELQVPSEWLSTASGVAFSATALANFLVAPALGRRGDRSGYRNILLSGLVAAAGIYLLQAFVTSAWQLVALRVLLGACMGAVIPSASAVLARSVPPTQQGVSFGLIASASFIGNTIGPFVGGLVAGLAGSRAVFLVTAAAAALAALLVQRLAPDEAPRALPGHDKMPLR